MKHNTNANTMVVVDASLENYQQLIDGIRPGAKSFLLDPQSDGIEQIGELLRQHQETEVLHLLSHGSPGCLYLGNSQLSLDTLGDYASTLQKWKVKQLLLYGCNVAAGDAGEELMTKLQALTGASLAASTTRTGTAARGGNWKLEWRTPGMKTPLALSAEAQMAYGGILISQQEYQALRALYQGTNGASWRNNTGWVSWNFSSSTPPDASVVNGWRGVTVTNDRVTGLQLFSNQLTGSIPTELGNLSNLEDLRLNFNQLTGSIPTELGNLSNLIRLQLNENQLTGSIPTELGNLSNLNRLLLYSNQLTGSIPTELGNLSNLNRLRLDSNQLTGSIPTELGNLSNLVSLELDSNQLTGSIPTELGNLSNLVSLELDFNQLTGSIPTELGNLSNLVSLELDFNQLTGSIPTELGNLSILTSLWLSSNQLTGSIPTELGNLSNLRFLWLHSNQLTGSIPTELGNLSNLRFLWLHSNQLTGSIPTELGNLSNLTSLLLYSNQLTGSIPTELGNLSNLIRLRLHSNQLTGSIPTELGNLSNLTSLLLYSNQLTGSIPQEVLDLRASKQLENPPYVKTQIPDVSFLLGNNLNIDISDNFGDINNNINNYTATGLPGGVTINSRGVISGTPTTADTFTVTVTAIDQAGSEVTDIFDIIIENSPPTDLVLSNSSIDSNSPDNAVVGTFSTTDPDIGIGDTFTYQLVTGDGADDNDAFTIEGNSREQLLRGLDY